MMAGCGGKDAGPECILSGGDVLGEVPVWDADGNRVWWLDVSRARLQSFDLATGRHEVRQFPGRTAGGWALRRAGGAVVALDDGLHGVSSGAVGSLIANVPPPDMQLSHRVNEAGVDCQGRLWLGVMDRTGRDSSGGLFRIDADGSVSRILEGITTPNGLCFDPSDTVMYFSDSALKVIWAFDFDAQEGVLTRRRVFCDLTAHPGMPDGAAVDIEGFLWVACFGGGQIIRLDPRGRVNRAISLPVTKVTSLTFGGPALRTLFITTASGKLTARQLADQPLAGGLFAMDVDVAGLPQPKFAG